MKKFIIIVISVMFSVLPASMIADDSHPCAIMLLSIVNNSSKIMKLTKFDKENGQVSISFDYTLSPGDHVDFSATDHHGHVPGGYIDYKLVDSSGNTIDDNDYYFRFGADPSDDDCIPHLTDKQNTPSSLTVRVTGKNGIAIMEEDGVPAKIKATYHDAPSSD